MVLEEVKKIAVPILQANGVEFAGVFGSVARGEDQTDSDVDILVRTGPRSPKGLAFFGLERALEKALGRKVDLVTEKYLHPYIEPYVNRDLKIFYGTRSANIHRPHAGCYRHYPAIHKGAGV